MLKFSNDLSLWICFLFTDDVPSEAQNVQALALSPTSIKVTWDQPAQTKGQLTKYELIYYQVGKTEEQVSP